MKRLLITLTLSAVTLALAASSAFARPAPARPIGSPSGTGADAVLLAPGRAAAGPARALAGPYTNYVLASKDIGNRLTTVQADVTEDNAGNGFGDTDADDGGWDFDITGAAFHPAGASYENLYGPIARGVVESAIFSADARVGVASGDIFAGISNPGTGALGRKYYRIYDGDIANAYLRWAHHIASAALRDTIKARHDTEVAVAGGTGARARLVRNARVSFLAGLWPWDVHLLANDSHALAVSFPGSAAVYGAEVDSISQVIMDDENALLGPGGWDPTVGQNYHEIGLAGACRVFTASPRADDNLLATDMRNRLLAEQQLNGAWGITYVSILYPDDVQSTAYAALALFEYADRFGDGAARAAALSGRAWLLTQVYAGGVVDAGGASENAEVSAEVVQALLDADNIAAVPAPGTCLSSVNMCVAVPVKITRDDPTGARGFSAKIQLTNLALCGAGITEAAYLSGIGLTNFHVTSNGGGSYTVDGTILGAICGATGNGTVFTVNVTNTIANGTGTIAVSEVKLRDCSNHPLPCLGGAPASIPIDTSAPVAVVLSSQQVKLLNTQPPYGTTDIQLSWTGQEGGSTVAVYRKGFGGYPQYDENGGAVPSIPATPAAAVSAGWALSTVTTTPGFDRTGARDFYYFVAYVTDPCGNTSLVSNRAGGTLNYHLGDTHDGAANCAGDDVVNGLDIAYLGFHYGVTFPVNGAFECLDVGPTTDLSVDARPTTDNRTDFEDLIVFAINYLTVSAPQARARIAAADRDAISLGVPVMPVIGETVAVGIDFEGTGAIQGVSVDLGYDPAVVEFAGVERGGLLGEQATPGVALSSHAGNVDVATLGTGAGLRGQGQLARALFRVRGAGDPAFRVARVLARDAQNRPVHLDAPLPVTEAAPPRTTELMSAMPNPFHDSATLGFSLARGGRVELAIFTVDGRRVRTLVQEDRAAGTYQVTWNGTDDRGGRLHAGLYYARLRAPDGSRTRKVLMVR